jgi:hypothetical protein
MAFEGLFRFFRKQRLASRGLSCGKTRRASRSREIFTRLEESPYIRAGILMIAASVLLLICLSGESSGPFRMFLASLVILVLSVIQPWLSGESILLRNSRLSLYLGMILLEVGLAGIPAALAASGKLDAALPPLLIPYALAPLTLSVLMGPSVGLSASVSALLWLALFSGDAAFSVALSALAGGMAAVLVTFRVRRRSRLLRAGFLSGAAVLVTALLTGIIPIRLDLPLLSDWQAPSLAAGLALGTGILTAVLVSGFLPALEQLFRITTGISWLEMADLNHPLLKRLSLEAPGTYHHSLAMANLAEACAERVGANPALCRVGAYFHDVGKLVKPGYFTENMLRGESPHDELTPTMSALVILSHVKEGVDLAVRHRLNSRVIDAIREHHGTTLVEYFYQKACRQETDARAGGGLMNIRPADIPKVSEENFRYPGPKPQSVETVILGLADAAESAVRSLERPTPQRIDDIVHDILQDRINDGQYDEAPVTLCQLQEIAATLVTTLSSMHHIRTPYRAKAESSEPVRL